MNNTQQKHFIIGMTVGVVMSFLAFAAVLAEAYPFIMEQCI